MRPRIPKPNPSLSIVDTVGYALTAILVFVVIVAVLQICGFHIGNYGSFRSFGK